MTKAIYAGSFDPLTNGHLWVIQKAAPLFDELWVAVGVNPLKKPTFSVDKRLELIEKTLEISPAIGRNGRPMHITVASFQNRFLVNYAKEMGCTHIVRGLRDTNDFVDEKRLLNIGLDIQGYCGYDTVVETVYFITPRDMGETSSGAVKALCGPEGWQLPVSRMVPHHVFKELEKWVEGGKQ